MDPDDWDRVVRVNLSGAFYLTRAVLNAMLERGYGRIVNISSVIGESGNIGQANYAATKSGLFGLTKTLALETARRGITVNCVAPGFIATDMVMAVPEDALAKVIGHIPVGRLGEPEEVARVVDFLVDPDAGYITGSVVIRQRRAEHVSGSQPDDGHGFGGVSASTRRCENSAKRSRPSPQAPQAVWMRFASDCMAAGVATMAHAARRRGRRRRRSTPARGDRRFKDPSWQQNPVYFGIAAGLSALVAVHARPRRCGRSRPRHRAEGAASPSTR